MLTIIYEDKNDTKTVDAEEVPVGQTFTGTTFEYTGLFLKIIKGVVFLDNPKISWSWDVTGKAINIRNYSPVDIEIIVKSKSSV